MNNIPLLIKREYWEHRGGFLWAPIWITGVILSSPCSASYPPKCSMRAANIARRSLAHDLRNHIEATDMEQGRQRARHGAADVRRLHFIGVFFVLFFYLLGALYDDRRDRSVLFWKSLPVSDTATVASKALAAMVVAPVIAFVVVVGRLHRLPPAGHALGRRARTQRACPPIAASHPLGMLWRLVLTLPISALWAVPTIGWLLFWSAYVRSKPFLWAVMVPLIVLMLNWWLGKLGAPHIAGRHTPRRRSSAACSSASCRAAG